MSQKQLRPSHFFIFIFQSLRCLFQMDRTRPRAVDSFKLRQKKLPTKIKNRESQEMFETDVNLSEKFYVHVVQTTTCRSKFLTKLKASIFLSYRCEMKRDSDRHRHRDLQPLISLDFFGFRFRRSQKRFDPKCVD